MPYTLLKFALWFGLAALIGGVIGWMLRSLQVRVDAARDRPRRRRSPSRSPETPDEPPE